MKRRGYLVAAGIAVLAALLACVATIRRVVEAPSPDPALAFYRSGGFILTTPDPRDRHFVFRWRQHSTGARDFLARVPRATDPDPVPDRDL